MRRLVPAAFVTQALVCLVVWFRVNEKSGQGAWSNTDFEQWVTLSTLCVVFLTVVCGLAMRRWLAAWAVAVGCLLAVSLGCAIFVGYAVFNSA
jgi:hypothetical protein